MSQNARSNIGNPATQLAYPAECFYCADAANSAYVATGNMDHFFTYDCFFMHFIQVNVMGSEKEKIQQSYSFKRLMADVLGETDF